MEEHFRVSLDKAATAEGDSILLLGITGGGKSTIANAISGTSTFAEGSSLQSMTTECQVEAVRWFNEGEPAVAIDTPGFLDSENRDAQFLAAITTFLENFPRDKLRVVVITLPVFETRANKTYKDMIDTIELLLGEQVWSHTMFVTTGQNRVNTSTVNVQDRIDDWKRWLTNTCDIPQEQVRHCNFVYGQPRSLEPLRALYGSLTSFTPKTTAAIHDYINANPGASVAQMINNVDEIRQLRERFEAQIAQLVQEKEETVRKLEEAGQLSARLQSQLEAHKVELGEMQTKLQDLQRRVDSQPSFRGGGGRCILF